MARRRPAGGPGALPPARPPSAAWLLAQVGGHAAMQFADRLRRALDLSPPEAGILRALPSRLVALVDGLESRGLVERRDNPNDRRTYALHLSGAGRSMLDSI